MLTTFGLTVFAWIFFRANNIDHAISYITKIFSSSVFRMPAFQGMDKALTTLLLIVVFILTEWHGREQQYAIAHLGKHWKRFARWSLYAFLVFIIGMFMQTKETPFIYFQF